MEHRFGGSKAFDKLLRLCGAKPWAKPRCQRKSQPVKNVGQGWRHNCFRHKKASPSATLLIRGEGCQRLHVTSLC